MRSDPLVSARILPQPGDSEPGWAGGLAPFRTTSECSLLRLPTGERWDCGSSRWDALEGKRFANACRRAKFERVRFLGSVRSNVLATNVLHGLPSSPSCCEASACRRQSGEEKTARFRDRRDGQGEGVVARARDLGEE